MAKRSQDKVGIYSDLPFNMKLNAIGDVPITNLQNSIKQSLFNILHTRKGARPLNPDFGCLLESYLFEPFDEITGKQIGDNINNALGGWEPRISVNKIDVNLIIDAQVYEVQIVYTLLNLQQRDSITFTLQKI